MKQQSRSVSLSSIVKYAAGMVVKKILTRPTHRKTTVVTITGNTPASNAPDCEPISIDDGDDTVAVISPLQSSYGELENLNKIDNSEGERLGNLSPELSLTLVVLWYVLAIYTQVENL